MSLGKQVIKGMAWSALERLSVQLLAFVIGIVLARLLTPFEYGLVGILIVFISFSQVFVDSGFSKALTQKIDRTARDIATVFQFNLVISLIFYGILFFTAPWISQFYDLKELTDLLRILALVLVIDALYAIPRTLFTIELNFKILAKINFLSSFIAGVIAIYAAYIGMGAMALVIQSLVRSSVSCVLLWYSSSWRPEHRFSKESFKGLWGFGSKLLISSVLNNLVNNFYAIFIAKWLSTKDLGYYTRGMQFADTAYSSVNKVFETVLLPALSRIQDQQELLVSHTRKIIGSTALLIAPIFAGLSLLSEPIIMTLLTEKWALAIPIMQLLCLARLITIISGININLLYVIGRTDLALRQQYLKISSRVLLLLLALPYGINAVAAAELAATTLHFFINTYYPGRIMNYGSFKQIRDMAPILLAAGIMTLGCWFAMNYFIETYLLQLLLIPLIGGILYFGSIYFLRIPELKDLISRLRQFKKS